jgi:hypothetical protein
MHRGTVGTPLAMLWCIKAISPNLNKDNIPMNTYQRRDYEANESISCGFKASGKLAEAINLAAELNKATSKSAYLMRLTAERVAQDLSVTVESLLEPEIQENVAQQEAVIATARLQQTIADAEAALKQLRAVSAPRRANSVSGFHRKAG